MINLPSKRATATLLLGAASLALSLSACSASSPEPQPTVASSSMEASSPWSDEKQSMATYIAADTVSRYLSEYEVTRQWQDSLGHWGTPDFKDKARSIDPSLNTSGEVTGISETDFTLENSAFITVNSTAGTFIITLVPLDHEVKVQDLKVD